MFSTVIDFMNVMLAALLTGAMFAVWLVFNPAGVEARSYVVLQQRGIRALHPTMPPLGMATILATIVSAILARNDGTRLALLVTTIVCFVAAGLVTRFLNMPINAIVAKWSSDAPPSGWTQLRDEWWRWHVVRLVATLVGLAALIVATLKRG